MLNGQGQVLATAHQLVPFLRQVLDLQFDFVNLVELPPEPEIDVIRLGGGLGDYLCHLSHTPRCTPHQNRLPSRAFPPHMPSLQ